MPQTNSHPTHANPVQSVPFLDRDQAILAFNQRVLDWARRSEVPLLERLRYLCIVSSNLDEFQEILRSKFMVRRLKKDVLKELPPKIYRTMPLEFDPDT